VFLEERDYGVLPVLGRAADRVECAIVLRERVGAVAVRQGLPEQVRRPSSDSVISIVVCVGEATLTRSRSGSNPGEADPAVAREERVPVAALADLYRHTPAASSRSRTTR